jgi:hypothetical protein
MQRMYPKFCLSVVLEWNNVGDYSGHFLAYCTSPGMEQSVE